MWKFVRAFIVVVTLFVWGAGILAEEAPETVDPPIDVIPEQLRSFRSIALWDFSQPNASLDDWFASPNVALEITDGVLVATSSDSDPHFISPRLSETASGQFLVRFRARRATTGFAQIFTAEEAASEFEELRSTRFAMPENDEWSESVVPVKTTSPLTRLRFDLGLDSGRIEIERIEILHAEFNPMKFGLYSIADGVLRASIRRDGGDDPVTIRATANGRLVQEESVDRRGDLELTISIPQDSPFVTLDVEARAPSCGAIARRFFAMNRDQFRFDAEKSFPDEWRAFESSDFKFQFATSGAGAVVWRDDRPVAALFPLFAEDEGTTRFAPLRLEERLDESEGPKRDDEPIVPRFLRLDPKEKLIEYALESNGDRVGSLTFQLIDDELTWRLDSPRAARAPAVKLLDDMTNAVLPGVEFLERGERSSSSADVAPNDRARFAPRPLVVTDQFAIITTDSVAATLRYDDPQAQLYFAVPDFLDGDETCAQMSVAGARVNGRLRMTPPNDFADVIRRAVSLDALPPIPSRPRSTEDQEASTRWALERGALKRESGGWASAVGSGLGATDDHFGTDFLSTLMEVGGELPNYAQLNVGGANLRNYASLLRLNRADLLREWLNGEARVVRTKQLDDGSFRYEGKYLRGSDVDYASGDCGAKLAILAEHWRLTANAETLTSLLRGLEFANRLAVPRGAQTWELSLHTPDILAAARMCYANVIAYEATDEPTLLDSARRWACLGLPFVYLWQDARFDDWPNAVMPYATIPVFGTTDWIAPCWIGTPVQWCGVDYAFALIRLARHDSDPLWTILAQGIVASAERQLYVEPPYRGLLPDSFNLASQQRNPLNINPCALHMVRRLLDGTHTNVAVLDVDGRRVVSPFPARIDPDRDNAILIQGRSGDRYQVLVDGQDVIDVESQGNDCVSIGGSL